MADRQPVALLRVFDIAVDDGMERHYDAHAIGALHLEPGNYDLVLRDAESLNHAYAEGRQDEYMENGELLRWAYSKLHHVNFTKQDDALMLDRFKLLLEHGVKA